MISLLLDHLFESTLVAMLLAVLTLCFANNRASVRYGLWFAASIKFLVPFSLIVAAGESLRWETAPAVTLDYSWAVPIVPSDLQLPVILAEMAVPLAAAPAIAEDITSGPDIESVLFIIWLAGMAVLLWRWTVQWLRLHAVRKASTPAPIDLPIQVRFSRMLFEPGLFGIFRPVLLLPEGIASQLSPDQLALVLNHELCHWRRRDNLTAAVHMAVQLVFWFHPVVWWIGARLVVERERACDEAVLAACDNPKAYADSILEVCRFYIRSPLACAPGVAGANLKHRVTRILENATSARLGDVKRAVLGTIAVGALALPMASGLLAVESAAATQRPNTFPPQTIRPSYLPMRKPALSPLPARKTGPAAVQVAMRAAAPDLTASLLALTASETVSAPLEDLPHFDFQDTPPEVVVAQSVIAQAETPAPTAAASKMPPPPSALDEIVVTAKRIRDFVRTRNFVRTYTAPSSFLDQVSRWHAPLCVQTVGLKPGYNAFVTQRLKEVATEIGAPTARNEPCDVNVSVIFTEHPQALLDQIRAERPELLGPHYPALRKQLATVSHPVQAWYATGTRDSRGRWSIDSYDGYGETIEGGPPVYYTLGSHLRSGLKSEFASVVIVADIAKVGSWEIGTIADYVAMLTFARAKTYDRCQAVPSVANVLTECSDGVGAASLSAFDMAYLKALYTSTSDAPRRLQESGISRVMLRILEQQVAAQKGAVTK
jgi:beta-lactamase regulating signal transducer with metallopeptidase domain